MTPRWAISALLSLAVPCAVGEAYLRMMFGAPIPFRFPQESYVVDPVIGHRLAPSQDAYTLDQPVRTNSRGFRGPELPAEPQPGRLRIAALGDSQTFGNGLRLEDTWPDQAREVLVRREPSMRADVLNAGISGTDTWQHVAVLRSAIEAYDGITHVVLAFYVNDVAPRYVPRRPAELTNSPSRRLLYLAKRSALFSFVWTKYKQLSVAKPEAERENRTLSGEFDPKVEEGWLEVERSLAEIAALTRTHGAKLLVVVLPRRDQVRGPTPPLAYNRRIAAIAQRLSVPSIDVLDSLRAAYASDGERLFIPWDGHNSALANQVIAREVVRWLETDLPRTD
jgi:lysophospholipase L1-like esterase